MPSKDPVLAEIIRIINPMGTAAEIRADLRAQDEANLSDRILRGHIHDYVWEGDE